VTEPLAIPLHGLLGRFRRQRPLRSGSLLVTILGDSIAPRGGVVTLGSLIRLAAPFGLPERLVRTSVARLAQDGWLAARRSGRNSEYRLTEPGRRRFAAATRKIYGERPHSWDGRWTLLVLPSLPAASGNGRERLREELRWLGFGQVGAGVLAHPSLGFAELRARLTESGIKPEGVLMRAQGEREQDDRRLIQSGWDLAELDRAYERFVSAFSPLAGALQGGARPAPETAFVVRSLLIHEYRKIHLRDPLLPDALLPRGWIGTAAYELCGKLYRGVFRAAERHLSLQAHTLSGALPAASAEARGRFRHQRAAKFRSDSPG